MKKLLAIIVIVIIVIVIIALAGKSKDTVPALDESMNEQSTSMSAEGTPTDAMDGDMIVETETDAGAGAEGEATVTE